MRNKNVGGIRKTKNRRTNEDFISIRKLDKFYYNLQ